MPVGPRAESQPKRQPDSHRVGAARQCALSAGMPPAFNYARELCKPSGSYSEQIGVQDRAPGYFLQALTHLSLTGAAFNLDR